MPVRAARAYNRNMIPINPQVDLDPDLRAEYEAVSRKLDEIWQERQRLGQRQRATTRMPDTIETYQEVVRLDDLEDRLTEREAACAGEQREIKKKHVQREIEKTLEWGKRNPSDEAIARHEQALRESLYELESET